MNCFKKPGSTAFFISLVLLLLPLTTSCSVRSSSTGSTPGSAGAGDSAVISAVVTFDALYELAAAVGGDRVSVRNIMPPGAEAHHFEPSARDLELLNTADLFMICGFGFEPWADSAVKAAGNDKLGIFDVSKGVDPIVPDEDRDGISGNTQTARAGNGTGDGPGNRGHESHDHHDGQFDPHIWLSPSCAVIMARNIADAFIESDPGGAEYYRQNFDELSIRLKDLAKEYSEKFETLENRTIVTGHAVFAYLCRDFGLTQNSVEGVFAEGEPSARALAELIDFCRAYSVRVILAESLSSPLVAETLASEAGASVSVIYTMESAEDGLSYLERMEHNLEVIYKSLQ